MKIKAETLFLRARNVAVPIYPQNYRTVLALCQDLRTSSSQLASIIGYDYGLSLKILRYVNSAFYSLEKNEFYSLKHVVVLLGLENLKNTLLKSTLMNIREPGLSAIYIGIGLFVSLISERLASRLELDQDKAKICGMFQNIGEVSASLAIPRLTKLCIKPGSFLIDKKRFIRLCGGYDPRSLGGDLIKFWNLPNMIRVAINPHQYALGGFSNNDRQLIFITSILNDIIKAVLAPNYRKSMVLSAMYNLEDRTGLKLNEIEDIFFYTYHEFEKNCHFFYGLLDNIGFFRRLPIG